MRWSWNQRVAEARSDLGITAEDAAKEMGIGAAEYMKVEAGEEPSPAIRERIADYLGVPMKYIPHRRGIGVAAAKHDIGDGRLLTAEEIATEAGISRAIAYKRIRDGIAGSALMAPKSARGGRRGRRRVGADPKPPKRAKIEALISSAPSIDVAAKDHLDPEQRALVNALRSTPLSTPAPRAPQRPPTVRYTVVLLADAPSIGELAHTLATFEGLGAVVESITRN